MGPRNPLLDATPINPLLDPDSNPLTQGIIEGVPKKGWGNALLTTIAPAIDVIGRPGYASARFADSLMDRSKSIFDALVDSFEEFVDPKLRLSYSDVIKKNAPEFARQNPKATAVLGFLGDVAFDPTTYLGIGFASKGVTIGKKALTKFGYEALERSERKIAGQLFITAPGGLFKEAEKDVLVAASKGIQATPQKITKQLARRQTRRIRQDYLEELNILGIPDNIKNQLNAGSFVGSRSKKLALDELNRVTPDYQGFDGVIRKLAPEEIKERAEQRLVRLASMDKSIADKFFEKPALSVKVGLPFGKQYDVVRLVGLEPLQNQIDALKIFRDKIIGKEIPVVSKAFEIGLKTAPDALSRAFVRPKDEPFKNAITQIENQKNFIVGDVVRTTKAMFKNIAEDRRTFISDIMSQVDDATREFERISGRTATQVEADDIYNQFMSKAAFKPEEMKVVSELTQAYKSAAELEMEAGLLTESIANYYPRYYQALADPSEVSALYKSRSGSLSTFLSSSQQRSFNTIEEAKAAGFVPELDAAKLYAARIISSRRAMAVRQFEDTINTIYNPNAMTAPFKIGDKEFNKLVPGKIKDDIRLLGESVYPSGMNETAKTLLMGYDKLLRWFKFAATAAKPSFAPKQFISNTMQLAFETNAKAFKSFDPRTIVDSVMLLSDYYRGKPRKGLPPVISNLFSKWMGKGEAGADSVLASRVALERLIEEDDIQAFAKQFELVNVFGTRFKGDDVIRLARENGVITSFDSSGEALFRKLDDELKYDPNNKYMLSKELFKFWKLPQSTENFGRMMGFIQGLRMGYNPKQAAETVTKALFDYQNGLTRVEKNISKIIPFYRFQRFAIPAVLRTAIRQPGNLTATQKVATVMEKLIADDKSTLTESEREIFGDTLLIEQPRIFSGFGKDGKARFNVLNNMTPMDALSLMVFDKNGEIDYSRTVQKTFLAALTPFVKIPLELAIDKNFFSGKAISDGGNLGDLKGSNADLIISQVIPEPVKDFIGWENRVNMRTGKVGTYVNPYLAYSMFSIVPSLRQYIRPLDSDKTALDGAMELFMGIVPVDVDLKEQKEWQALRGVSEAQKLQQEIRFAVLRGSENLYERSVKEYRDYMATLQQDMKRKNATVVRGQGITPLGTEEVPVSPESR